MLQVAPIHSAASLSAEGGAPVLEAPQQCRCTACLWAALQSARRWGPN